MTQQYKNLFLKDLCARLPHGIVVSIYYPTTLIGQKSKKLDIPLVSIDLSDNTCTVGDSYGKTSGLRMFNRKGELLCKPYLRPMSSMTEEEKHTYLTLRANALPFSIVEWLDEKHFDQRTNMNGEHLIEIGLALEAPEGIYES